MNGEKHDRQAEKERSHHRHTHETPQSSEKADHVNATSETPSAAPETPGETPNAQGAGNNTAPAGSEKSGEHNQTPEAKLAGLEAEVRDLKDKYLRKYADFENYKKRMAKEREESARYSNATLLLDIVTVIDDFERAIKSAQDGNDFKNFHTGISMIEKQLVNILEKKWGLERFLAKGQPFDPERHEALMAEQSAEATTATVVEDLQSGYLLHGRVLRPAKVKVLQPLPEAYDNPENGKNA